MGTDSWEDVDWSDVYAFSTAQDAVILLDPSAECCKDDLLGWYWVRMAKGGTRTDPTPRMDAAWDMAIEILMDLFAEPTHGSMLDRLL